MKKNISVFLIIFPLLILSENFAQEVDIVPYLKKLSREVLRR